VSDESRCVTSPSDPYYDSFRRFDVPYTVKAIAQCVERLSGNLVEQPLRDNVATVLVDLWTDYTTWLNESVNGSVPKATDSHAHAAARICDLIADSMGQDVFNEFGVPIPQEVNRNLLRLTENLANFYRDKRP